MNNEIISKISQLIKKTLCSSVLKVAGIYTFSNFASAAIPFFLMPVLTRYLTPADYGLIAIFGVLVGLASPFIGLNTQFAISIKYFKISKIELPKYITSSLIVVVISCLVIAIFSNIFKNHIEKTSDFPGEWLWAVIIVCFGNSIIATLLVLLRSAIKPYPYVAVQLLQSGLNVALSVWFVVWLNMNWQGRINAQVITAIIFTGVSFYLLYKNKWLVFLGDIGYIKDAIKFGVPLLPTNLSGFSMRLVDRFIIVELLGLTYAGIYSVGAQFATILGMIASSCYMAYSPWLFSKLNNATDNMKKKIVGISYVYIICLIILAVLFSKIMPIVLEFFVDKRFYGANEVLFWAFLAQAFANMWGILAIYIFYAEKTYLELWVTIPTAVFHVIFCYIMVKENGIVGASQAAAATYFIKALLGWILSNKVYPMPWFSFCKNLKF